MGSLHSVIDLGAPPEPTEPELCAQSGGQWNYETNQCQYPNCPVIIDLDGNGYRLTGAATVVSFDIDADGTKDSIGWTKPDEFDAFFVLDRNGNGAIDDGSELFGTSSPLTDGTLARNGFIAIANLDDNGDGQIDAGDSSYASLRLWLDVNHNGVSEPPELKTLSAMGLTTLHLSYEVTRRRDGEGNLFKFKGTAFVTRRGIERLRQVFDVLLTMQ